MPMAVLLVLTAGYQQVLAAEVGWEDFDGKSNTTDDVNKEWTVTFSQDIDSATVD